MKFLIEKTLHHTANGTVTITTREEDYFGSGSLYNVNYIAKVLVKVSEDFDMEEKFPIVHSTASVQYRPKSLYRNTKGVFYSLDNKRVYLNELDTTSLEVFCEKAAEHIKNNGHAKQ